MSSSSSSSPAGLICAGLLAVLAVACLEVESPGQGAEAPRAILVAVDALNEKILGESLPPESVPALLGYFRDASCAKYALSHFPSVTAASLATVWTGAYGDVSGVTANNHHALPPGAHTVMDRVRGFGHEGLMAEPLWVTSGRVGVPVAGHHVTQAPGVPGFPLRTDDDDAGEREARRAAAADALARDEVSVLNGYNILVEPHRALHAGNVEPGRAGDWEDLEDLESEVEPRAFSWETAAGRFHGLLFGTGGEYDAVLVNTMPRVTGGIRAFAAGVETADLEGRPLARHFSEALPIPVTDGTVHLRVRLFRVAPDGSDFLLYHPSLQIAEGNDPEMQSAYEEAVRGWVGNSALSLYSDGAFGPTLAQGGDGLAEARLLETAELMTRQFMRGSEWLWRERKPVLLTDYFPLGDEADHNFYGYLDPRWPGYDEGLARRIGDVRARMWSLVDLRVAHLRELAREADAGLFITGDHGIRATWRQFAPNPALAAAGLLALDENGQVDLARTRAVSPNGYWITVNRQAWDQGIVPPEEESRVLAEARRALEELRGPDGEPVVIRTFTPDEAPEMGLGGPAGGDLYWATAEGYRWTWRYTGPAASEASIWGAHGFPPDEPDMHTVFCAAGSGFPAGRFPAVRLTVVAPTVADYVGLPTPRDAVGVSVLSSMLGGG
jgi:hypothetical protein